jgi:hypothetical protein
LLAGLFVFGLFPRLFGLIMLFHDGKFYRVLLKKACHGDDNKPMRDVV